ncbi:hypothetical protein [Streptomyces paludis]|uniref:hypothetical protein n=1 Tax=Streptomyces paludis TaxID=2282738 RepID=UPI0015F2E29F|nr:hypothetical protein [Streptomyces paludis]
MARGRGDRDRRGHDGEQGTHQDGPAPARTRWRARVTAAAVLATYHHRPSDVLGSTLPACAWYLLAVRVLPSAAHTSNAPDVTPRPRALSMVALTAAAVGALVAGARDESLTQSLVFAAAAFACAALFWFTTSTTASTATVSTASTTAERTAPVPAGGG